MKHKKLLVVALSAIVITVLFSCTNNKNPLIEHIKFLTNKELEGRLPGTDGNTKAAEYIKNYFSKIGLQPYYEDNFFQKFTYTALPVEEQIHELVITYKNGKNYTYEYGSDYYELFKLKEVNLDSDISVTDNFKDNSTVVLSNKNEIEEFKHIANAILVKESNFSGRMQLTDNGIPVIQIRESIYNDIIENKAKSLHYEAFYQEKEIVISNVIGIIPGTNPDKAVVISAHFDQMGKYGDCIFSGAVDNASGVSCMLEIAKSLVEISKEKMFEYNIIFCGFNAEEQGRVGSKAFVETIKDNYKNIYNINIDTVGKIDGNKLVVEGNDEISSQLFSNIKNALDQSKMEYITGELGLVSDHESFIDQGIQAVNIGQEDVYQDGAAIDSEADKSDLIDYEYLSDICKLVVEVIKENDSQDFSMMQSRKSNGSDREYISKIMKQLMEVKKDSKLKYNEYMFVDVDGLQGIISGNQPLYDLNEIYSYYPTLNIDSNYSDYKFYSAFIYCGDYPMLGYNNLAIDPNNNYKIKKRSLVTDGNLRIETEYHNDISNLNLYIERQDFTSNTAPREPYLFSKYKIENIGENNEAFYLKDDSTYVGFGCYKKEGDYACYIFFTINTEADVNKEFIDDISKKIDINEKISFLMPEV